MGKRANCFVSAGDLYTGLESIRETLEEFQSQDMEYYNEVISLSQHILGLLCPEDEAG